MPDIPPIGNFVPGYEASSWDGIGAPANTPPEIVAIISKEVNAALRDPSFKARLADLGVEPFPISPAELSQYIVEYTEKWGKVIRAAVVGQTAADISGRRPLMSALGQKQTFGSVSLMSTLPPKADIG